MLSQRCRANLYANDGLLTHAGEIHHNKKYIQPLLNLLVQFSFLQNKARKSGGLLCSKNNGLPRLSNGPYGLMTSLLVLA